MTLEGNTQASTSVEITEGTTVVGRARANGGVAWSATLVLPAGGHVLGLVAIGANNTRSPPQLVTIVIDQAAGPELPRPSRTSAGTFFLHVDASSALSVDGRPLAPAVCTAAETRVVASGDRQGCFAPGAHVATIMDYSNSTSRVFVTGFDQSMTADCARDELPVCWADQRARGRTRITCACVPAEEIVEGRASDQRATHTDAQQLEQCVATELTSDRASGWTCRRWRPRVDAESAPEDRPPPLGERIATTLDCDGEPDRAYQCAYSDEAHGAACWCRPGTPEPREVTGYLSLAGGGLFWPPSSGQAVAVLAEVGVVARIDYAHAGNGHLALGLSAMGGTNGGALGPGTLLALRPQIGVWYRCGSSLTEPHYDFVAGVIAGLESQAGGPNPTTSGLFGGSVTARYFERAATSVMLAIDFFVAHRWAPESPIIGFTGQVGIEL